MRVLIKNPAPLDDRLHMWGDYHFGQSLSHALEAQGCTVVTHYHEQWGDEEEDIDLLLMLRGKHRFDPPPGGPRKAMWIISHPETVSDDELSAFDVVFAASAHHAKLLETAGHNAHCLLQCTDVSRFHPQDEDAIRQGFVFIGNTRSVRRPIVGRALDAGLPLQIWGRGWGAFGLTSRVRAQYFNNEDLGTLYRRSLCTLNDHWPDMIRLQYVNNRIFDALACGLPVFSDFHPGIAELKLGGVVTYTSDAEFDVAVERILFEMPLILDAARADADTVLEQHTFERRAEKILSTIEALD